MNVTDVCSLLPLGLSPLCPCPRELTRLAEGAGRGFPQMGRLLVCPAEAVKGSHQGQRHKNSPHCRDGKTEAAWGSVQDPMARQPFVGPKTQRHRPREGPQEAL